MAKSELQWQQLASYQQVRIDALEKRVRLLEAIGFSESVIKAQDETMNFINQHLFTNG